MKMIPLGRLIQMVNQKKDRLLNDYLLTYGYYRDPVSRALLHSLRSMYYPAELKTVLSVDLGAMTRMLDRLACKG